MSKIRDILIHVHVEEAMRTRKCSRNKKITIPKGEKCLVVKTGSMNSPKSYSCENARPMLDQAWNKLKKVYESLGLKPPKY